MVLELTAIISGVNAATAAIKKCAEVGQDLESVAGMIQRLGESEVQSNKLQQSGKLNEADALKATLAKKQIEDQKQQIKDLFMMSGNGHLYTQMVKDLAEARKAEQRREAARLKRRKENLRMLGWFCLTLLGSLIVVPIVIWGIIAFFS